MAKKKKSAKKGKVGRPSTKKSQKGKDKKVKGKNQKSKGKDKAKGKKRGRKLGVPNKYNAIKSAISKHYYDVVGRKVKHHELKIIYKWIDSTHGEQPLKYILMNIDSIIDSFWQEYCNLYPVDITNFARYFEWYNFKTFLNDEKEDHYPTDIIQVDLTAIDEGIFEFLMEDYAGEVETYYEICKQAGIKRESPPPALYLEKAYCDVQKRGNVFEYKLLMDEEMDAMAAQFRTTPTETNVNAPQAPTPEENKSVKLEGTLDTRNVDADKEKLRLEYELKQQKLKELAQLLKDKVITFKEYMEAIRSL